MKIVILDAQGGGMGRQLVEGLKKALPNQPLIGLLHSSRGLSGRPLDPFGYISLMQSLLRTK